MVRNAIFTLQSYINCVNVVHHHVIIRRAPHTIAPYRNQVSDSSTLTIPRIAYNLDVSPQCTRRCSSIGFHRLLQVLRNVPHVLPCIMIGGVGPGGLRRVIRMLPRRRIRPYGLTCRRTAVVSCSSHPAKTNRLYLEIRVGQRRCDVIRKIDFRKQPIQRNPAHRRPDGPGVLPDHRNPNCRRRFELRRNPLRHLLEFSHRSRIHLIKQRRIVGIGHEINRMAIRPRILHQDIRGQCITPGRLGDVRRIGRFTHQIPRCVILQNPQVMHRIFHRRILRGGQLGFHPLFSLGRFAQAVNDAHRLAVALRQRGPTRFRRTVHRTSAERNQRFGVARPNVTPATRRVRDIGLLKLALIT